MFSPMRNRQAWRPMAVVGVRSPGRGLVLFLAGLMLSMVAPAEAQFSVQPVIMELRTGDAPTTTSFAARNESAQELRLRIYVADFDQPADGSHEFMEAGTHARSCSDRLQVHPSDLTLPPGGEGEVRVHLEPGDSTCWSLIFVQSQSSQSGGIRIAQRIGVKVYGVSTRAVPAGEISRVAVDGSAREARTVEITFDNTGDGPVRPEGELEIRTMEGRIVTVVPVQPFSVLPGRSRVARVPLDTALDPGRYLVIPILDFGADYLAGGQATFEVPG